MPKKHMSGFVPIPFKTAGKILLPISLIMIVIGGFDYFVGLDLIPLSVFFFGLGLLIVCLYLIFVVTKEE